MTSPLLVYVAGPYRGPSAWAIEQNVRAAEVAGLDLARIAGVVPVIPHSMYRHFQGTLSDEFWLRAVSGLLRRCDALFLLWNWRFSRGAVAEAEEARTIGIPVFEQNVHPERYVSAEELVGEWARAKTADGLEERG